VRVAVKDFQALCLVCNKQFWRADEAEPVAKAGVGLVVLK
jgi:hypothetical protein